MSEPVDMPLFPADQAGAINAYLNESARLHRAWVAAFHQAEKCSRTYEAGAPDAALLKAWDAALEELDKIAARQRDLSESAARIVSGRTETAQ